MRSRITHVAFVIGTIGVLTLPLTILSTAGAQANQRPQLKPIEANFVQAEFATYYTEDASDPDGDTLTYGWDLEPPQEDPTCNKLEQVDPPTTDPNRARWKHGGEADGCHHTAQQSGIYGHLGTITVFVTDGHWTCSARYYGSSNTNGTDSAIACEAGSSVPTPEPTSTGVPDLCVKAVAVTTNQAPENAASHDSCQDFRSGTTALDVGGRIEYRYTVSNIGSGPAHNVVLRDTLPPDVQVVERGTCHVTEAGIDESPADRVRCELGTVQPGIPVDRFVIVRADFPDRSATDDVRVWTTTTETNSTNNSANVTVNVRAVEADVVLNLRADDFVRAGQRMIAKATVKNAGPRKAENVKLIAHVEFGSPGDIVDVRSQTRCSFTDSRLECKLGDLGKGETVDKSLVIKVANNPKQERIVLTGVALSKTSDPEPDNNEGNGCFKRGNCKSVTQIR